MAGNFQKGINMEKNNFNYIDTTEAYNRGFDCGLNGVNDHNSNFRIFSTPENTKAWEKGKSEGKKTILIPKK